VAPVTVIAQRHDSPYDIQLAEGGPTVRVRVRNTFLEVDDDNNSTSDCSSTGCDSSTTISHRRSTKDSTGTCDDDSTSVPPLTKPREVTWMGTDRVYCSFDARKLKSDETQLASPPFELPQHPGLQFIIALDPKVIPGCRSGFRAAKGVGRIHLKCTQEIGEGEGDVTYRLGIGHGPSAQGPRGPVTHTFAASAVSGLPKDIEDWDFTQVACKRSRIFAVYLDIVPPDQA